MTIVRFIRAAWAAAIVAAAFAFLFLAYAPVPGSHVTDRLLTIGVAAVGAAVGVLLESKLSDRILRSRSTKAPDAEMSADTGRRASISTRQS